MDIWQARRMPRKVKVKGSSVHNPAIERRVWQFAWRRELKESAAKDVLEALMQVIRDKQWPIKVEHTRSALMKTNGF